MQPQLAPLACTVQLAQTPVLRAQPTLVAGLIQLEPHTTAAVPATVVFMVDGSGSMGEGRAGTRGLDALQAALNLACDTLPGTTTIGVVSFNDHYSWIQRPTPLAQCRSQLQRAIRKLQANGSTRFAEPLAATVKTLRAIVGPKVLVLLTDGQSSVKPDDDNRRCQTICSSLQADGIDLWVFGAGVHYDYEILERWTTLAGGGSVLQHVQSGQTALPALFNRLAQRVAATQAFAVTTLFTPAPGVVVQDWLRTSPQTRAVAVQQQGEVIDDLQMLDQHGAQWSFRLTGSPPATARSTWTLGTFTITFSTARGPGELQVALEVGLTDQPHLVGRRDADVHEIQLAAAARVAALAGATQHDPALLAHAQQLATQLGGVTGTTLLADLQALGSGNVDQQRSARTRLVLPDDGLTQLGS